MSMRGLVGRGVMMPGMLNGTTEGEAAMSGLATRMTSKSRRGLRGNVRLAGTEADAQVRPDDGSVRPHRLRTASRPLKPLPSRPRGAALVWTRCQGRPQGRSPHIDPSLRPDARHHDLRASGRSDTRPGSRVAGRLTAPAIFTASVACRGAAGCRGRPRMPRGKRSRGSVPHSRHRYRIPPYRILAYAPPRQWPLEARRWTLLQRKQGLLPQPPIG